jgi:hypothetical protein
MCAWCLKQVGNNNKVFFSPQQMEYKFTIYLQMKYTQTHTQMRAACLRVWIRLIPFSHNNFIALLTGCYPQQRKQRRQKFQGEDLEEEGDVPRVTVTEFLSSFRVCGCSSSVLPLAVYADECVVWCVCGSCGPRALRRACALRCGSFSSSYSHSSPFTSTDAFRCPFFIACMASSSPFIWHRASIGFERPSYLI